MVSSADVASHAGVSRSTVSQILNGHEERFVADTVARVRESASTLGYRPSTAGRTLRRGTSDIVITLVPDMAFSRYFRDLVGELTRRLAGYGYTNLLRLASSGALLEDAVLSLRPFCVVAVAPLPAEQRSRLTRHRVKLIEPTADSVTSTNVAIGRLQAEHLAKVGYRSLVSALPESLAEAVHVLPRAEAARAWAGEHGMGVLPTLSVPFGSPAVVEAVRALPSGVGVAAYNDDVALAVLGAAIRAGRQVPDDLGVMGADHSHFTTISMPSLTTVSLDVTGMADEMLRAILAGSPASPLPDAGHVAALGFAVVPGESTDRGGARSG